MVKLNNCQLPLKKNEKRYQKCVLQLWINDTFVFC